MAKGELLTYDDVEWDRPSIIRQLRELQDRQIAEAGPTSRPQPRSTRPSPPDASIHRQSDRSGDPPHPVGVGPSLNLTLSHHPDHEHALRTETPVPKFVYDFSEGDKDQKALLGGKGANLAEMTRLGLPVPPGFTITTDACREFLSQGAEPADLRVQVTDGAAAAGGRAGRRLGDRHDPLLVSVRSGAQFSMPGMMETVLNIGLNDASVKGLAEESGNERFAWDSYRRLLQMFGKTVLEMPGEVFSDALDKAKTGEGRHQTTLIWTSTTSKGSSRCSNRRSASTPGSSSRSTRGSSWTSRSGRSSTPGTPTGPGCTGGGTDPQDLGTAVNVCTMVFGNLGDTSGTGVAFTRDPAIGPGRRLRRLPVQRSGRGRGRRHPEHAEPGRPGAAGPDSRTRS